MGHGNDHPGRPPGEPAFGFFQLLILLLSLYVVGVLVFEAVARVDGETQRLLDRIDFGVCLLFLSDFGWRFHRAPNKWEFMRWGWIDLVSSIPVWNGFFLGRLVRALRILRLVRAFRSVNALLSALYRNFPQGAVASVAVGSVFVVIFASVAILEFERDEPGANVRTAGDALWWAITTITTVGYGDKYPVTAEGRVVAVILMVTGGGLFSTITALIASQFVGIGRRQDGQLAQLNRIEAELASLRRELRERDGPAPS